MPAESNQQLPHISVCICTFKRPALLARALRSVCLQETKGRFTYSVIVTDNDKGRSAQDCTNEVASTVRVPVKYCVEPQQGIAMARNRAVQNACGEFVVFIDDDEFAPQDWLLNLLQAFETYPSNGVLAPVNPHFDSGAPQWVIKGGFYDRPVHPTGMLLRWNQCRTGNVLLQRELFASDEQPFKPECLSGEDQDFFRRKIEEGKTFIWCHEAGVLEVVPEVRWKRTFLMRRALFRGIFAQRNHGLQPLRVIQALVSAPVYLISLPIALVFGQARFMTCVFKLFYHAGRLFALCGFNPIRGPYVYE